MCNLTMDEVVEHEGTLMRNLIFNLPYALFHHINQLHFSRQIDKRTVRVD